MKPKEVCIVWKLLILPLSVSFLVFQIWQTHISLPITQSNTVGVSPPFPHLAASVFYFSLLLGLDYSKENSTSISSLLTPLWKSLSLLRPSPKKNSFSFYWMRNALQSLRAPGRDMRGRHLVSLCSERQGLDTWRASNTQALFST